ncbi:MAG: hypothetical protein IKT41_02675 [Clostridia bacterium]|nr:hypothetical protein [Clostridia bacterium]
MKKVYLIPILSILILMVLISSVYATLDIKDHTISDLPVFSMMGNDIFCIEKEEPIGKGTVEPGTTSYTSQQTTMNWPSYTTVGEYNLPAEIAYILTSNASIVEKQYAIWASSMNNGGTLQSAPTVNELVNLSEYNLILQMEEKIKECEDKMQEYILKKDEVNKLIAEIKMQNTNLETVIQNTKVQSEKWPSNPDMTYIQKMYDDNQNKISELEANGGDSAQIEKLKLVNEKIKSIIDSKSYAEYITFLEECVAENNQTIEGLTSVVTEYEKILTEYENTIEEYKKQTQDINVNLEEEYDKLYDTANALLNDGLLYKDFYQDVQKAGGYNPTSSKDKTKLVKLTNNTYKAGPFKLHYIQGNAGDTNFSYIENMYLVDQEGHKIEDIEIIQCEQYDLNKKYPASDAEFYIKFKATEKDVLEDTTTDSSTWREGRYTYTQTKAVKTYSVKLIVNFKYLNTCGGKYSRLEGTGDIITWDEESENIDGKTITYWVAKKDGEYKAQTLIAVDSNPQEITLDTPSKGEYTPPTREWVNKKLEVPAFGRDEDTDTDKKYHGGGGGRWRRRPEEAGGGNSGGNPGGNPEVNPDPTPTPTPEPLKLTMEVAGYVFEDIAANKENTANGLLDYNSNDKLLEGIEVAIYEENGELARLIQEYEENPDISMENAEIRTNPTITDKNGYYKFKGLDPDKKYYIEFRYNGLTHEATTYKESLGNSSGTEYTGDAWKVNSKAVEKIGDRIAVNGVYEEIKAYPGSYKKAYDIGLGVAEYNKTYMQADLISTYELITTYIQNYINSNRKYPDILEIYKNIYNDQIANDSEIANKLQFIEDSKISAYTSANGDTMDLYPIYEEFAIEEQKVKIEETYEPIYTGQKYINLGIKAREEFDLAISKDVYKAEVQINGKVQNYNYNNVEIDYTDESWNAHVKGSDIGYDRNIYASDYFAKDMGVNNLEVYVTYRIALRNQTSPIIAGVTKLVDYYDNEYTYVGNSNSNNFTGVNQGKAYIGNGKGEFIANAIWQDGVTNGNYNTGYITFENGELNLENGADKFVYITFKVNRNGSDLLYSDGEIKEDGTVVKQATNAKQNIVEIAGYKTYYKDSKTFSNGKTIDKGGIAGIIDKDSIAGNLNPNIVEDINKEDDSDKASGFSLLIDWSNFRGLSGNVWEELPTENSINEGTRLGNGEKDSNEANIKNVTVKVLIAGTETLAKGYVKKADGTYEWQDLITVTDDDGKYVFTGYIPGDYKLRFTYGNVSEDGTGTLTEEMKKYNGQDYKSTIYNSDATVTTARIYWYSLNSDKLKSDAKDIWTRREAVNADYIELNNKEANLLKKDSVNPIERANKTWMIAETDELVLEVEYARTGTESVVNANDNHIYQVENIDLGLVERPRSQLLIEKDVSNVKVILADRSVLFDAILNSEGKLEIKNSNIGIINRTAKTTDIQATPAKFEVGRNGQITMNMDEELMQGAEIHITYKVSAKNVGEIDYTTQDFYYNGTKGTNAQIVKTSATTIVDYVSNNLGVTKISSDWTAINKDTVKTSVEFTSDIAGASNEEYTNQTIDKYNNILKTNALSIGLNPGEGASLSLLLTTSLSPDNDADDLRYDNILELIESKNDVGRRHELSILGNQDPTKEVAELDSGKAETVLIIPPFGMNDNIDMQISIAIILIAAFGMGVYYIKRRVLK